MPAEAFVAEPGRLDAVVARLAGRPRADVQRAIDAGAVLVDGMPRPKSHRLLGGEALQIDLGDEGPVGPEGPPVPVRFEDEQLLVVFKPAGLVTHPTARRRTGTLVNRLLGMGIPLSAVNGPLRPGIVHRLDAGTSGLMLVAKDDTTHEALARAFAVHAIDRRYLALVRGVVEHDGFAVDAPLGRRAARVRVDVGEGRSARTGFEVRERFARATLLEATPRTGRTHQIRVHLSTIGHPILGDRAYGGAGADATALRLDRPFLHAWRIGFAHPVSGRRIELEEPLPEDLERALGALREGLGSRVASEADAPDLRP
jgi:23S rRNA pseudouridine1911/1915/1917 synthase